jgi:hypothetical protein
LRAAKKLVEQDKVDILIAPLSGSEGIALRDYVDVLTESLVHLRAIDVEPEEVGRGGDISRFESA